MSEDTITSEETTVVSPTWESLFYDSGFWEAIAWPLSLLLCVIVLRGPVKSLFASFGKFFDRDIKYNPKTGALEMTSHGQNAASLQDEGISGSLTNSKGLETIPDYLKQKISQLEPLINQAIKEAGDIDEQVWLKARLIEFLVAHQMEIIYRNIFGSQLRALNHLIVNQGARREQILEIYATAKSQYPDFYDEYTFDQWVGYMVTSGLIATQDDRFYITEDGKGFLTYLSHHQYYMDKVL